MVNYRAKVKGAPEEVLTEEEMPEWLHFFPKEEIEYVYEIVDNERRD